MVLPVQASRITVEQLLPFRERLQRSRSLLLQTGWDRLWGDPGYFTGFPVLDGGGPLAGQRAPLA